MKSKRKDRKKRQLKVKVIDKPAKKAKGSVAKRSGKAPRINYPVNAELPSPGGAGGEVERFRRKHDRVGWRRWEILKGVV